MLLDKLNTELTKHKVNFHYLDRYLTFLKHCDRINSNLISYEKHHILPKSIYPEYRNLSSNKWNCIKLTHRQHFISHVILSKVFLENHYKYKMLAACIRQAKQGNIPINSKKYESLKLKFKKACSKLHSEKSWYHCPKTLDEIFTKDLPPKDYIKGRSTVIHNKGQVMYYSVIDGSVIYIKKDELPPENYIKGTIKSTQKLYYNIHTLKAKYFSDDDIIPSDYSRGSPLSASWKYIDSNTGDIIKSKVKLDEPNLILQTGLAGKSFYTNLYTGECKAFAPENPPNEDEWVKGAKWQEGIKRTAGRVWYNDGVKSKMFYPTAVPEGFVKGRL